jgi:hypothetical protein
MLHVLHLWNVSLTLTGYSCMRLNSGAFCIPNSRYIALDFQCYIFALCYSVSMQVLLKKKKA